MKLSWTWSSRLVLPSWWEYWIRLIVSSCANLWWNGEWTQDWLSSSLTTKLRRLCLLRLYRRCRTSNWTTQSICFTRNGSRLLWEKFLQPVLIKLLVSWVKSLLPQILTNVLKMTITSANLWIQNSNRSLTLSAQTFFSMRILRCWNASISKVVNKLISILNLYTEQVCLARSCLTLEMKTP